MKKGRYAASRQKACEQCVRAKTRCQATSDGCARCAQRELSCTLNIPNGNLSQLDSYSKTVESHHLQRSQPHSNEIPQVLETRAPQGGAWNDLDDVDIQTVINWSESKSPESSLASIDIELVCTINAKDIRNRWLNAFAPEPGQITKEYPPHVVSFIFRMLKSYTATLIRGSDLPPFLHSSQAEIPAISRCLTLVQTCTRLSGSAASILAEVLENEIDKTYGPNDFPNLRSEFQANLIYMMVLYFCYELDADAKTLFRRGILNLQELACVSSETGIVCLAEKNGTRPSWEAWIAAETQRRSIYLMYMFDNLLSARDGLQTFLGTELCGLPAPSARDLWSAHNRQNWEILYNDHLLEKTIPGISIDELWPRPPESGSSEIKQRQKRIDRWLEGVDEFGTMLYAVTCCTHGD